MIIGRGNPKCLEVILLKYRFPTSNFGLKAGVGSRSSCDKPLELLEEQSGIL
jgi:hypothetical protein